MDEHSSRHGQGQGRRLVTSTTAPAPSASQRRNDESWVEISSQPSSSSLSSIGDEIVTTGLHVAGSYPPRNRRRSYPARYSYAHINPSFHAGAASSQDEYEASESEEDNLASSTEQPLPAQLPPAPPRFQQPVDSDTDSDDDENATALGTRGPDDHVFRPQPNAFSNPPSTVGRRRHSSTTTVTSHPHSSVNRPHLSQRAQARAQQGQPDFLSPSYQADNDAALRASLTTLLSCAAAARGLPKHKDEAEKSRASPASAGTGPSNQPMELRLVPESELMNDAPPTAAQATGATSARPTPLGQTRSTRSSPPRSSSRAAATPDKAKRGASSAISRGTRASKKKKTAMADDTLLTPTLMTWVFSAGVVVLVSVVGFGAGYVIGREVGRQEVLTSAGTGLNASDTTSCGREVMQSSGGGLRRLKWTTAVGKTVVTS